MAAAEARASWHRTLNHRFIQQDAKEAPKLACNDSAMENLVNAQVQPTANCLPVNWNTTNSDLSPGTISWLQLRPNFPYQKGCTSENLKFLLDESINEAVPTTKLAAEPFDSTNFDPKNDQDFREPPWVVSTVFMKQNPKTKVEMKSTTCNFEKPLSAMIDSGDYFPDEERQETKQLDWLPKISEKTPLNMGIPLLVERKKSRPWWCNTDKDELAFLVAQRSVDSGDDFRRTTQTSHACVGEFSCRTVPEVTSDNSQNLFESSNLDGKYCCYDGNNGLLNHSKSDYSDNRRPKKKGDQLESTLTSSGELSRTELLEALCRSQTRARKAEIAAQQACDEQEDLIKLLFQQASHLFAYKQWLHMLQLENLCLRLRLNNRQISSVIPPLPWMSQKLQNKGKSNTRGKLRNLNQCDVFKLAIVVAIGVGLAGMGFLFGWTLGRLLPAF